jgi:hypothetical protein
MSTTPETVAQFDWPDVTQEHADTLYWLRHISGQLTTLSGSVATIQSQQTVTNATLTQLHAAVVSIAEMVETVLQRLDSMGT